MNPTIETTTEDGTKVIITPTEGVNIPTSASDIASTIKNVSLPTNMQIDQTLSGVKEIIHEEAANATSKIGQTLAKDAEELIDSTTQFLYEKNKNDKLQKLMSEGKEVLKQGLEQGKEKLEQGKEKIKEGVEKTKEKGKELASEASNRLAGLSKLGGKAESDVEDLYSHVRSLGYNFVKSDEFRHLLADWIRLFQALSTEKIKKQAHKKRKLTHSSKGGKNIAAAVEEGLEQPEKPASEEELMEQTQKDFNQLLDRISKSDEYNKAIKDFYQMYDELKDRFGDVGEKMSEEAKGFKSVFDSTLGVVGEFVGNEALDKTKDLVGDAYNLVNSDKKLSAWFADLRKFLTETIENPLSADQRMEQVNNLLKKGRTILQQPKWRKAFSGIYESLNNMLETIKNDTVTQDFALKLKQFGKDFALNEKGLPDLLVLEESVSQMKNMIIPLFKKQLDNLPIKRIEITNDTYDVKLEDMIAVGSGFLPEKMDIHMSNDSHMNFVDGSEDKMSHRLEIQVSNIKPEFKNMKFYYKRKSFPTIEDFGMADLIFNGDGCNIKVVWRIDSSANSRPVASLEEATCTIDNLSIRIVGEATKHEILDTLLAPFVAGLLKNKLANIIEEYLSSSLNSINDQLNKFFASSPTQQLKEKANQALLEKFNQYQQTIKSV